MKIYSILTGFLVLLSATLLIAYSVGAYSFDNFFPSGPGTGNEVVGFPTYFLMSGETGCEVMDEDNLICTLFVGDLLVHKFDTGVLELSIFSLDSEAETVSFDVSGGITQDLSLFEHVGAGEIDKKIMVVDLIVKEQKVVVTIQPLDVDVPIVDTELWFVPQQTTYNVGDLVKVDLYVANEFERRVSALENAVLFSENLQLLGTEGETPDVMSSFFPTVVTTLNDQLPDNPETDGDASHHIWFQLGSGLTPSAQGSYVVTYVFEAVDVGEANMWMSFELVGENPHDRTTVYDGYLAAYDVTGDLAGTSVMIN